MRETVFERDGGRCQYCQLAQLGHGAMFHIDHIFPRSKSGPTALDNLALQCPNCSLHKADKTTAVDPDTGQMVSLFHPLQQAWNEHFRLHESGECMGLTPVGRATAAALQMNMMIPRFARACQIRLRLLSAT
jgi:hypothetical protein